MKAPKVDRTNKPPDVAPLAPPSRWQRARRLMAALTRTKKVVTAILAPIGILTTGITLYKGTIPDVQILGPDTSPFLLPYAVTNTSWVFDMTDVVLSCGPRHGQEIRIGNIIVRDVNFQDAVRPVTMGTGQLWNFRCPISNASAGMVKGTIHPTIKYKTLGFARTYEGLDQTWYSNASPPRWVQGRVPDQQQSDQ